MAPPFEIPADVTRYIDEVFSGANMRVSAAIANTPNIHEESLDFLFIGAIQEFATPAQLPSGFIVDFDIHFIGGGRHIYEKWEVADIGVIVLFRQETRLVRTKVALLQSKRLYPREVEFVESEAISKPGGYGWLTLPTAFPAQLRRQFTFDDSCRYSALQVGDPQWHRIAEYEEQNKIPVHYLLYHPHELPHEQVVPVDPSRRVVIDSAPVVGARVIRASSLRVSASRFQRNYSPSIREIQEGLVDNDTLGLSVNSFVSAEAVQCREGYIADDPANDTGLNAVFNQRTGPISAAFRITIQAPAEL